MKKIIFATFILLGLFGCNSQPVINTETELIETGINPDTWITIPAGTFFSGMVPHEKLIDYDYEMMLTHVTNGQYAKYLNEAFSKGIIKIYKDSILGFYKGDPFDNYLHEEEITAGDKLFLALNKSGTHIRFTSETFNVDKGFDNHPVINVTWFGANAYAKFYHYRLPTELEWEKAARGKDTRAYPWGNEISSRITNYKSSNTVLHNILGGNVARTTPVGYYNGKTYDGFETEDNRSPYGLYDMGGNVWQWVGDDYPKVHYRYMRGGSFTNYEYNIFVWARNSAGPDYSSINIGFRCARDISKNAKEANADDNSVIDNTQVNNE